MNSPSYSLQFGSFSFIFPQRMLFRDGQPVRLGSRAINILAALIQAPGDLLGKEALLRQVWPDSVVDEGALRVHMSAVRKALGTAPGGIDYISNEPGRGYRFCAPVTRIFSDAQPKVPDEEESPLVHNLPSQITRVLGRDDIIDRLLSQLEARRCLTISGPGGLGKTTVALAIAHRFVDAHTGRACFVDFAPLSDPGRVAGALATALGIASLSADPVQDIITALGDETLLLLLDNCEHMVAPLAPIAERLLREASGVHLLATSREPLRANGEWIHRLATLETPPENARLSVHDAVAYPAVRLFIERARAVRQDFTLDAENIDAVIQICRSLDGIPLAIEFAAARADWLDAHAIAAHLDARFNLLTKGRRTVLPRQQTLRATLDWSYDLLEPRGQAVLRRVALFRTSFDMTAMLAVALPSRASAEQTDMIEDLLDDMTVFDAADELVAKSLLNCDMNGGFASYRLLDTTRYYGVDRLQENSIEEHAARYRHALYCVGLFTESQDAWDGNAKRARRALHSLRIDDIRSALDWAFSPAGDAIVGINLVVASAHLWFELSIPDEFFAIAELALGRISDTELNDTRTHFDLLSVYGGAHWPTCGPLPTMGQSYSRAMEIARRIGDTALLMRAAWGMWIERLLNGHYAESLRYCDEYYALAKATEVVGNISTGHNMLALSHHFLGDTRRACKEMHTTIDLDAMPERESHANAAQLDGNLSARGTLTLLHYFLGEFTIGLDIAHALAEDALAFDHAMTLCAAFSTGGIPVTIWAGERHEAAVLVAALRERAQRGGMVYWDRWGEGYQAVLEGTDMDLSAAAMMQIETFAGLGLPCALDHLETSGRRFEESWVQPELMRQHAVRSAEPHGPEAIGELEIALQIAHAQHAGLWILRISLNLAQAHGAGSDRVAAKASRQALAKLVEQHGDASHHADVLAAVEYLNMTHSSLTNDE